MSEYPVANGLWSPAPKIDILEVVGLLEGKLGAGECLSAMEFFLITPQYRL